jgi:putative ABC transport system permease protein
VAVLSLTDGVAQAAERQIIESGSILVLMITPRSASFAKVSRPFTNRELTDVLQLPGVSRTALVANSQAVIRAARIQAFARLRVTTADFSEVTDLRLAEGRYFSTSDASHGARVAVLSYQLARELEALRGKENLTGSVFRINGVPRVVIGILADQRAVLGRVAYIPLSAAGKQLAFDEPPALYIRAIRIDSLNSMRTGVEDWLSSRDKEWQKEYEIVDARVEAAAVSRNLLLVKLLIGTLAVISLIVGSVGIMNVLLASVSERIREIAVRRAVGARRRDIQLQMFCESMAISAMGTVTGLAFGFGVSLVASILMRVVTHVAIVPTIAPTTVLLVVLAAWSVGLSAGIYPARVASELALSEGVGYE